MWEEGRIMMEAAPGLGRELAGGEVILTRTGWGLPAAQHAEVLRSLEVLRTCV